MFERCARHRKDFAVVILVLDLRHLLDCEIVVYGVVSLGITTHGCIHYPVYFSRLLGTGRSDRLQKCDAQAFAFLIAEQVTLSVQLVPDVAFGKKTGPQRIDVDQPEGSGAERLSRRSFHFSGGRFFLPGPGGGGGIVQLPLLAVGSSQAADQGDQRELRNWSRAVLSHKVDAAERVGA